MITEENKQRIKVFVIETIKRIKESLINFFVGLLLVLVFLVMLVLFVRR